MIKNSTAYGKLNEEQQLITRLMMEGLQFVEIAEQAELTHSQVIAMFRAIYRLLDVDGRDELIDLMLTPFEAGPTAEGRKLLERASAMPRYWRPDKA
jgi:DNA-binding CsgD family transcriptional regulator